ncbi:MAG TPA: glycoside hydrolase [Desulfomicrobium sp.]|nr:glycoside hydrolase [Desulfomicrobium sp.]
MPNALCIHGHFYQPPRFDPWLETVLPEGSAAPEHDWNARITRECYAPLAWARRLDGRGRIHELVNCYAWMSFNFGPTLLRWMELHAPQTYARVLEGDRLSLARLGHGNALAQVYHHAIMPLATDLDKDLEVAWAVQDFRTRFGRDPEGMWLAETAVDLPTLSALARAGIGFTILAPRQAKAVRSGGGEFRTVTEDSLDTSRPYLVRLPEGKSINVYFYDGAVSRAVAFERLLASGENFWTRLTGSLPGGLRHIATDGESYGHHFMFGEMALAYVIQQAREGRDGIVMTNYAAYLAAHPATCEALIHENTSWSCVHGLERWKTHCGCSDGGHPDWMQDWRRPLRRSLNYLKYYVDEHFFKRGAGLFLDPGRALRDYGLTLAGGELLEDFLARHCPPGLTSGERTDACRLLLMQRLALAGFASCAWFFDEVTRIEPLGGLTSARRALDLLSATGGPDVEAGFVRVLSEAHSNIRDDWDGEAIWKTLVTPRRPSLAELSEYAVNFPDSSGRMQAQWPGLRLEVEDGAAGRRAKGFWTQTLEEEDALLPDGPAHRSRFRTEVSYRLSREMERGLLAESSRMAEILDPLLAGFDEGQKVPQERLALLAPGLVWNWLFGGRTLPADVLGFLNAWLSANKDMRNLLEGLVEERGTDMARDLSSNSHALTELIARTRRVGMSIYWWEVQNLVMAEPKRCVHEELCLLLNLSLPEA